MMISMSWMMRRCSGDGFVSLSDSLQRAELCHEGGEGATFWRNAPPLPFHQTRPEDRASFKGAPPAVNEVLVHV